MVKSDGSVRKCIVSRKWIRAWQIGLLQGPYMRQNSVFLACNYILNIGSLRRGKQKYINNQINALNQHFRLEELQLLMENFNQHSSPPPPPTARCRRTRCKDDIVLARTRCHCSEMLRLFLFFRSHFFKVLTAIVVCITVLQYSLSVDFRGPRHYLNFTMVAFGGASWHSNPKHGPHTYGNANSSDSGESDGFNLTLANSTRHGNSTFTEVPLCPALPPKLVGRVKVLTEAPPMEELEKLLAAQLEPGGRFHPKECKSRHRVAIVIPYRDREEHLRIFLHNIHPILGRQQLDYGIYIVEEAGDTKFNRAMLMNIGFAEALKLYDWQCFVFHDVDLLPEDDRNIYSCPEQPRHMSVAVNTLSYKLPYAAIFGGVSALTVEQMLKVNGFSNEFWGWGGEDDDMSNRIKYYGYTVSRYSEKVARYTMMKHTKDKPNPDRYNKLYKGKTRYKTDGLNSLKYKVLKVEEKTLFTWILVELKQP